MLTTLAISNYRSLLNLTLPLGRLNVITGANGSGKSNLYRALRLLAETAHEGVVGAPRGKAGCLPLSGPDRRSCHARCGPRRYRSRAVRGRRWCGFGWASRARISAMPSILRLPKPSSSKFALDPEIKREAIWAGTYYRAAAALVERKGPAVKARSGRSWTVVEQNLPNFESMSAGSPTPARLRSCCVCGRQFGAGGSTTTPHGSRRARPPAAAWNADSVLHHDGRDLAAALETIQEIGDDSSAHRRYLRRPSPARS